MKKFFFKVLVSAVLVSNGLAIAQPISNLENPAALSNFYNAISAQNEGKTKTPIHVIMIGDSHTASDLISASLRFELQSKFGNAGRGLVQAGYPYDGFAPLGLEIKSPKKWSMAKSFPVAKSDIGPYGLGGFRARVAEGSESYNLIAQSGNEFDRVSVCANTLENGTKLGFEILNSRGQIDLANPSGEIECVMAKLPQTTSQLSLFATPNQSPVGLASIGTWHDGAGIILSSFGIVGSQAYDLASRNSKSIAAEFAVLPPKLIILEFGTNEGFDPKFDAAKYAIALETQLNRLKQIAPDAAILLIGAPDANKKANGALGAECVVLDDETGADFPNISRKDINGDYYSPPPLKLVRKVQREVAEKLDVAFWDWSQFMGGECSANRLALLPEKEILNDRVHFSKIGAQKIGKAIATDIISGFEDRGSLSNK